MPALWEESDSVFSQPPSKNVSRIPHRFSLTVIILLSLQLNNEEMRPILISATAATKIAYLFLFLLIGVMITGMITRSVEMIPAVGEGDERYPIYLTASLQALFAIALPAIMVAAMSGGIPLRYLKMERSRVRGGDLLFGILLFITSYLFVALVTRWNSALQLPESMRKIEEILRSMEDAALETTTLLLSVDSAVGLLLNLLVIAGFAALSEELFFRGVLQQLLQEWWKSRHAAVWVTALIFSLIHFQFYGFFPRLLLGALLGYLFLYTENLWVAILFHFINNAFVIVMHYFWSDAAWFGRWDELPLSLPFIAVALVSALLSSLLFWIYLKRRVIRSEPTGKPSQ